MTKETILKISYEDYKRDTARQLAACVAVCMAVIAVNVLLYHFVTEATAALFTVINIVLDTVPPKTRIKCAGPAWSP